MRGLPHYAMPGLEETLEANLRVARLTNPGVRAVGIALNTSKLSSAEAHRMCGETRSEEHTSELQSLMRISYAVFCLKKNKRNQQVTLHTTEVTQHKEQHYYDQTHTDLR